MSNQLNITSLWNTYTLNEGLRVTSIVLNIRFKPGFF